MFSEFQLTFLIFFINIFLNFKWYFLNFNWYFLNFNWKFWISIDLFWISIDLFWISIGNSEFQLIFFEFQLEILNFNWFFLNFNWKRCRYVALQIRCICAENSAAAGKKLKSRRPWPAKVRLWTKPNTTHMFECMCLNNFHLRNLNIRKISTNMKCISNER